MLQTLEGFLEAPFGEKEIRSNEFEAKYKHLASEKRIHMEACVEIDGAYLVHIKVGSDSNANVFYDVILLFFTDDPTIKKDISFRRYYVQFFSNSPSFIYQYATLYQENGMMIDMLADKLDQLYAGKKPEKTNPRNKLSYDKSIYAVCRWMQDHKISGFSKVGYMARKKKKKEDFFSDIKTFDDIKFDTKLNKLGTQLEKTAAKETDKEDVKKQKKRPNHRGKITAHTPTTKVIRPTKPVKSSIPKAKKVKRVKRK